MPQLFPSVSKWTTITTERAPLGRIGHTFCANEDGSKAYVYGGVNDSEDIVSNYLDDFWEYDVLEKTWTEKILTDDVHHPRAFHSAVWHRNQMFVFGGCNGRGRFNKLFTIDGEGHCHSVTVQQHFLNHIPTPIPSTRYCHSAVAFEGRMYVFGGKCGGRNSNKRLKDLYMCTLDTPMWLRCEQLGDIPPSRSAHTALTYGHLMIVFGGRNSEGECCDDLYAYHFHSHLWRRIVYTGPAPFSRARNSAVVHGSNIIVFGGWNGKKKLNDLFIYNIEANVYEPVFEADVCCPTRRECHVAVMCRNTMVVFGGRFRGTFMSGTSEIYLGPKSAMYSARDWLVALGRPIPEDLLEKLPWQLRVCIMSKLEMQRRIVMDRPLPA